MEQKRREFLKGTAWMAAAAMTGGCASALKTTAGGTMAGYVAPKLGKIRVGVVGIGGRGSYAVHRLSTIPGIEITALCDFIEEKALKDQKWLKDKGFPEPKVFTGPEGYKRLCESGLCDVVHNNTDWSGHVPVSAYAMKSGLHAFVEVPGVCTVDEAWELVETSEKTRRHCMMLENCCYGEDEMLMVNLARAGALGTIVHGEGGYLHDGRWVCPRSLTEKPQWRFDSISKMAGNSYPTHGFGPVAIAMNVNRGDRLDYLVSMGSVAAGFPDLMKKRFGDDSKYAKMRYDMEDINTSMVRTVNGRTIMVQCDMANPRPYSRMNLLQGSSGIIRTYPLRIGIEKSPGAEVKKWSDEKETGEIREKYRHPLWKQAGEIAKKVGGHGGMDYLMDLRWAYCLQNGLPLDMDVYDLAAWSCIVELTEKSSRNRSARMDIPDFTRGGWKTVAPFGDWMIDLKKMDLRSVSADIGKQQTV